MQKINSDDNFDDQTICVYYFLFWFDYDVQPLPICWRFGHEYRTEENH